jgi:hypothetical protein
VLVGDEHGCAVLVAKDNQLDIIKEGVQITIRNAHANVVKEHMRIEVDRWAKVEVNGPLQMMGPPVSETQLYNWCMANLKELDPVILRTSIISAYTKSMKKNGYEVTKQKLHRTNEYRLIAGNHLTTTHTD